MAKISIKDVDLGGKRVLLRVDYNVPMEEENGRMVIDDATRIESTLPTLNRLIGQGAKILLAAHLGRPKGRRVEALSLRPVAEKLADMIARPVAFVGDCVGERVEKTAAALLPGDVLLLENLRYYAEEESNDPGFRAQLAAPAQAYVNDAFGASHRAHASIQGVAEVIGKRGGICAAGLLMEREIKFLGEELEQPSRPFVVILGGAKVSDKIAVIDRLIEKADVLLIGGAMAYTFQLAKGRSVGKSLVEPDKTDVAKAAMEKARERGVRLLLPSDTTVATPVVSANGRSFQNLRCNNEPNIPDSEEGVDIGTNTVAAYAAEIARAKTILWNGPMGIFEDKRFAAGTFAVAKAVAEATKINGAKSIVGGGDSVKAVNRAGLAGQITFMSTGGGASLEFLEGKDLPGVAAIPDA